MVLRVLMNGELDQAMGLLGNAEGASGVEILEPVSASTAIAAESSDNHWQWRSHMAQCIGEQLDAERFGVKALYLLGSAKNTVAGPDADIDLLVHVGDDPERRRELELWLDGWSRALAEVNFLRTGRRSEGLLDVRCVGDREVALGIGVASKIGAVTDPARLLACREAARTRSGD
jgi:hypothetical protein